MGQYSENTLRDVSPQRLFKHVADDLADVISAWSQVCRSDKEIAHSGGLYAVPGSELEDQKTFAHVFTRVCPA